METSEVLSLEFRLERGKVNVVSQSLGLPAPKHKLAKGKDLWHLALFNKNCQRGATKTEDGLTRRGKHSGAAGKAKEAAEGESGGR